MMQSSLTFYGASIDLLRVATQTLGGYHPWWK